MAKNYNYDIGISSENLDTLISGARLLHSAGVKFATGPLFDLYGRPREYLLNDRCKGLHIMLSRIALWSSEAKTYGPYRTGYFNLDDPVGFTAFVQVVNAWAPPRPKWSIKTADGVEDYTAETDRDRRVIRAGCVVVPLGHINEMIAALENKSVPAWTLRDSSGRENGKAIADVVLGRVMVRGAYPVTLATLKEMQKALT